MIVTALTYHRNGVCGAGYYAARVRFRGDGRIYRNVLAIVFDQEAHIAIVTPDGETSFRYEDFADELRAFIESPAGQRMAFPYLPDDLIGAEGRA
jgi:hypothetical protein